MYEEIKVVFKSGRSRIISLHSDESFEKFWKEAVKNGFFIAGDLMFNINEVEFSEIFERRESVGKRISRK